METPQDILKRIQDNNFYSFDNPDVLSPDNMMNAIKSGEVQNAVNAQAHNDNNMITDLLGGGAIGFGNTVNDTIFGGAGQIFKNLGRLWEKVSPFSGRSNNDVNAARFRLHSRTN